MTSGLVENTSLHWADILVLVAYFVFVLAVGLWSSCKGDTRESISGYFLAGRDMHWLLVGASLFGSNTGSGHYIGLAGTAAASGIAVAGFEINAIWVLMLLGWVYIPVYIASGVYTLPEYIMKRFGGRRIRIYLSCLAILLSVFTKISAELYAGAIFINRCLDWDLYASIGILLLFAAIFTAAGGLTAVIWTDAVQVAIMLFGAFILLILSLKKVGGYDAMVVKFFQAIPKNSTYIIPGTSCHIPPAHSMNLMRAFDQPDLPWTGMTFGLTISAVWYWCSDQVIVQRALAAKNYSHAKAGCILAGCIKILPMWLLVVPGMIARVLYPDTIGCTNPVECKKICGSSGGCTNIAYPELVIQLMPPGLRGLMLACMMSALMSSLTSIFNSSATLFTMDVWKTLIRPKAGAVEQLIVGKIFVVVLVVISILWIPIIQNATDSQLFNYIQAVTSYLAPPVCAVYVLAIFVDRVNEQVYTTLFKYFFRIFVVVLVIISILWIPVIQNATDAQLFNYIQAMQSYLAPPVCSIYVLAIFVDRVNEQGAFAGLMVGFAIGLIRFFISIAYPAPLCGQPDYTPSIISKVHFLHFGILLFLTTTLVTLAVSLLFPPPPAAMLRRTTFWSRYDRDDVIEHQTQENISQSSTQLAPTAIKENTKGPIPSEKPALWKKVMRTICGVDLDHLQDDSDVPCSDTTLSEEKAFKSLDEDPRTKKLLDILGITTMALTVFYWAFFS